MKRAPSLEIRLAFEAFPDITKQLTDAGYELRDEKGHWEFSDNPPGFWCAQLQKEDGHQVVVISIGDLKLQRWGVSYGASLCGSSFGTCYWAPNGECLGSDEETLPLADAVLKARMLNQEVMA